LLPPSLTLADLRRPHHSIPRNPLLAEPLYLTKYIERMGTGTRDMITKCRAAGLPEPEFTLGSSFVITIRRPVTAPVTAPVNDYILKLLKLLDQKGPLGNAEILIHFTLKDRRRLRETYLDPALINGLIERTIPDKPTSRLQQYKITDKGRAVLIL
jgi:ATP-dependent DNA helicase RecG